MEFEKLIVEDQGAVVCCAFTNPPRETFVGKSISEMHRLLTELESNDEIRVLMLTGASDDYFIRHYEVEELADMADANIADGKEAPSELPEKLHGFNQLCLRLENAPYVTIAALNGSAAGGGCELALSCDFRLMREGPYHFGLPETNIGIIPGGGGTQRLARLLGTARALDLILHGTVLNPYEALEVGLVHRVYPAETFSSDVGGFIQKIANRAPLALRAVKQSIRRGADLPLTDALLHEQLAFDQTMVTRDAARSMRAYLEAGVQLGDMDFDFEGN